jgi:hypothetical protein
MALTCNPTNATTTTADAWVDMVLLILAKCGCWQSDFFSVSSMRQNPPGITISNHEAFLATIGIGRDGGSLVIVLSGQSPKFKIQTFSRRQASARRAKRISVSAFFVHYSPPRIGVVALTLITSRQHEQHSKETFDDAAMNS